MVAVGRTLDHQSQESTDCRWVKVLCMIAGGKCHMPPDILKEFLYYPNFGDMKKVRPSIRASEIAFAFPYQLIPNWPESFWIQCLKDTPCFPLFIPKPQISISAGTTKDRVDQVRKLLIEHFYKTLESSAIDPRHDTAFGVALYCLNILEELLHLGVGHFIIGRIALRTIAECFITLAYLAKKNDQELWRSYRVFGSGQAKLAFLKVEELEEPPKFINIDELKSLASDDLWLEFLEIELGHWEKGNLRKLSIEASVKEEYDRYYSWTSTFSHGHWGAIRNVVFETCGNPLHRLHRIPKNSTNALEDVISDAVRMIDKILEILSVCYPEFKYRLSLS